MSALILTYHAIEEGRGPLFVDPDLFERHLDAIVESGASVLTVAELGAAIREDRLPERAVSITFDDGFASVAQTAAPLLLERGLSATVFCVGGWLGRTNDWPSQPRAIPRRPLATAAELAEAAAAGLEIGAHGMTHAPLSSVDERQLRHEVVAARVSLEGITGAQVGSFAYPYGVAGSHLVRDLVGRTYSAACTVELRAVSGNDGPLALPRVDVHYIRPVRLLRRAVEGSLGPYLGARSVGARMRRRLLALRTA